VFCVCCGMCVCVCVCVCVFWRVVYVCLCVCLHVCPDLVQNSKCQHESSLEHIQDGLDAGVRKRFKKQKKKSLTNPRRMEEGKILDKDLSTLGWKRWTHQLSKVMSNKTRSTSKPTSKKEWIVAK